METRMSGSNESHHLLHRMVLDNDKNTVEMIIQANPALLLERKLVTDHHGLRFEATPLQLAFATLNFKSHEEQTCWLERVHRSLLNLPIDTIPLQFALATINFKFDEEQDGMVEMIHRYFLRLPNGEREFRRQFNEWFPDSWLDDRIRADETLQSYIKKLTLLLALKCEGYEQVALSGQAAFKEYLDGQLQSKVVTSGIYFDPMLMAELTEHASNSKCFEKNFWLEMRNIYRSYLPFCLRDINTKDDVNNLLSKMGRIHDMHSDFSLLECKQDSPESYLSYYKGIQQFINELDNVQDESGLNKSLAAISIANNPFATFSSSESRSEEKEVKTHLQQEKNRLTFN